MSSRLQDRTSARSVPKPGRAAQRLPLRADLSRAKEVAVPVTSSVPLLKVAAATLLVVAGVWSYLPTIVKLAETWNRVDAYSHGYLVLPLAMAYLGLRHKTFPGLSASSPWLAMGLLTASLALRHGGDLFFIAALDGWSIIPWTAALAAVVGGLPVLRWSWPAILFLVFMVPLPYSLENELSGPLQRIATLGSTAVLQFLGQPAFDEGNVILIGDMPLEVAQACSGLRLFVFFVALAYALVVVLRRPWWENLLLIAATAPIAIVANMARIVVTGLLFRYLADERARHWIHAGAGWAMVLFAAALFALLLWYVRRLVKEEQIMDMSTIVKHSRA
jgi:exosortase